MILIISIRGKTLIPPDVNPFILHVQSNCLELTKFLLQGKELIESISGHRDSKAIQQVISIPQLPERDLWVFSIFKQTWQCLRVDLPINQVILETDSVTFTRETDSYTSIFYIHPQNVLPLEGAFFSCKVRYFLYIILLPNELNPLNVFLSIKFIQLFHQKCLILQTKIDDPKTPLVLGFLHQFPCSQIIPFSSIITSSPKTVFPVLVDNFNHNDREL